MFKKVFILGIIGYSYALSGIHTLESNPGASNVIYIHIKGGQGVNNSSIQAMTDSAEIQKVFDTVVEDFHPFDVNVTTNQSIYDNTLPQSKVSIAVGAGGVGYAAGKFGDGRTDWHAQSSKDPTVVVHELGHTFFLSHDGVNPTFNSGYLAGTDNWSPNLGSGYSINTGESIDTKINHWYNGYKDAAHNQQEDLDTLTKYLGLKEDDFTSPNPILITNNDLVSPELNKGQIGLEDDKDTFYFSTSGGQVSLDIKPNQIEYPNLIVGVSLYDESMNFISSHSGEGYLTMEAKIDTILEPGKYFIEIDGVGLQSGVASDYSSFGPYTIEGSIENSSSITSSNLKKITPNTKVTHTSKGIIIDYEHHKISKFEVYNTLGQLNSISYNHQNSQIIIPHSNKGYLVLFYSSGESEIINF